MLGNALKNIRLELGITQSELAQSLNVNFTTVNRWENGKAVPNRLVSKMLVEYAKSNSVSDLCVKELETALSSSRKNKLSDEIGASYLENESVHRLINNLPVGIGICRVYSDGRFEQTYVNDGYYAILGTTRDKRDIFKGTSVINAIHPDDCNTLFDEVDHAVKMDRQANAQFRAVLDNGKYKWLHVSANVVEKSEEYTTLYCVFSNIDELKCATKQISTKETQQKSYLYKNIVEDSSTVVLVAECKSRKLIYVNKKWRDINNIAPNVAVLGKSLYDVMPCSDMMIEEQLNSLQSGVYSEFYHLNSKGQYFHIRASKIMWNKVESYICYVSDETDLWNSHQQLQSLIDLVPSGIAIYEVENDTINLKFVNNAYPKMLADDRENKAKYIGKNTINAVHPNDVESVKKAVKMLVNGADMIDIQFRLPNANGEYVWVRMIGSVVERVGDKLTVYCSYSNCDDIMKTQQALQSNRIMLNAAMKSAKVNAWKLDIKNRRIVLMKKYDKYPQVIDNVPQSLIKLCGCNNDEAKSYAEFYEKAMRGEQVQADLPIPKGSRTDEYSWNRIIYTPVFDGEGQLIESIGTSIDITEQKDREQSYEEQLRLKKLLANNALAVGFYNLTDNVVIDSQTDVELFQQDMSAGSVDDVLTKIINETVSEQEKAAFVPISNHKRIIEAYNYGQSHFAIRHRHRGDKRWLETSLDIITNPYTDKIEAICAIRDVTKAVRAEQIVNTLMSINYESIVTIDANTGAPVPFTHSQMKDVIEEQRLAGDTVLGVEAYIRKHCVDADVDRVVKETSLPYVKHMLKNLEVFATTYSLNYHNKIVHKQAIYTYLDSSRETLLCAVQDLTDTYAIEEKQKNELAAALKIAEKASKAKTDFFSRMSHDMRTPMNGILGLAELSLQEQNIEVLRHNICKIEESGQYLLSLINDTLDFQRIETGKMKLEPQVVKTKEFLESISDMIRPVAKDKNIDFRVISKTAQYDKYVKLDPVRVKQVFVNLLSNAIKFTPTGGTVSFEYECVKRVGMVSKEKIVIRDTGIGMSEDYMKNGMFKPFSQEYNQVSTRYAGSGLGLSIVYKLVKLMGGSIEAQSEQGVGTTFTLYMDFEKVCEEEAMSVSKNDAKQSDKIKTILNNKQLLLVEDHPLNAEIAIKLLEKIGCKVDWQSNGKKGVDGFNASSKDYYDAVLMDIRMPVMNGLEAARAIRALNREDAKKVPIIAMTANAYDEDVRQSFDAGMNAHLAKPINPQSLYKTIADNLK